MICKLASISTTGSVVDEIESLFNVVMTGDRQVLLDSETLDEEFDNVKDEMSEELLELVNSNSLEIKQSGYILFYG